jgi:type I restriction enzyme M protein
MLDDIKKTFWATADKLRANMDAVENKHLVLGLIFVKCIKARTLITLRDTLLPRLISGQLPLPKARAQLGAAA